MMNNPEITVLMPVYNGERYLREAIESILNQTFKNFEFLIINDCSTDGSREIILSYNDERIRLIDNQVNMGQTKSLNKGLRIARGRYIARIDQDDISLPERLRLQAKVFHDNPELSVIGSSAIFIDGEGEKIDYWNASSEIEDIMVNIFFNNPICHSSAMMKREEVLALGGYDERYLCSQDFELWSRFIRKGYKISNIEEYLVKIRKHENSALVGFKNREMIKEISTIIFENINHFTEVNLSLEDCHKISRIVYCLDDLSERDEKDALEILNTIYNNVNNKGYCSTKKSYLRKVFSDIYYKFAVHLVNNLRPRDARRNFFRAVRVKPNNIKSCLYFLLTFIKLSQLKRIRMIKSSIKTLTI